VFGNSFVHLVVCIDVGADLEAILFR